MRNFRSRIEERTFPQRFLTQTNNKPLHTKCQHRRGKKRWLQLDLELSSSFERMTELINVSQKWIVIKQCPIGRSSGETDGHSAVGFLSTCERMRQLYKGDERRTFMTERGKWKHANKKRWQAGCRSSRFEQMAQRVSRFLSKRDSKML